MSSDELDKWLNEAIDDYSAWTGNLGDALRDEITQLRAEVERLKADAEKSKLSRIDTECLRIGQEIQRAAGELPDGFEVCIEIEKGSASVVLYNHNTADSWGFNDMVDGLSYCITQAIDVAKGKS